MINFFRRIAVIVRKEFLAVLKDPKSRFILVVPAIVQSLLFGYAATYDLTYVPYALNDASHSAASAELLAKLDASGTFRRTLAFETQEALREAIDSEKALLAISIPVDFERRLYAGEAAPLQIVLDGRNSNTAGSAAAYVGAVVADFNHQWRETHGGAQPALRIESRAWSAVAGYGVHSSNTMTISASSTRWMRMDSSGVRKQGSPLTGDWKRTPSSVILRNSPRLYTWYPPESVRIGPSQPMKRCSPPCAPITSSPGRSHKWKVLPSTICAPSNFSSCGLIAFTVP